MAIPGLRRLFRLAAGRSTAQDDAVEELRLHLELRAEELVAEGMDPEAARAEALRRFGNLPAIRNTLGRIDRGAEAERRRGEWLDGMLGDLRQAFRGLRRNPGFAVATILTCGLGIGLVTAVFSIYHGVILRAPPYADPDRVVRIWSAMLSRDFRFFSVSAPDFRDWKSQSRSFERLAAYERQEDVVLTGGPEPEQLQRARVSFELFALLGTQPVLGRVFVSEEDRVGASGRPVILSYGLWQRRFGGRMDILGRVLTIDGEPRSIIGVMPRRFVLPGNPAELWMPIGDALENPARARRSLRVLGRLAPGATLESARTEFATISRRLQAQYPATNAQWTVTMLGLTEALVGERFNAAMQVLLGAVGLVLLIACANVATMVLGRNLARSRELALRSSLGAGAGRLGRLLLSEGLVLGVLGGVLGVAVAIALVRLLQVLEPASIPRLEEIRVNLAVLGVAAGLAVGSGLVFGLFPLRQALRPALTEALREGGKGSGGSRRRQRTQRTLVVVQLTLAIILLSGASLLVRSLLQLQGVELGFEPGRVLAVDLALPREKYPGGGRVSAFYQNLLERLRAQPGVLATAAVSAVPLGGPNSVTVFAVEGRPLDSLSMPDVDVRTVTPGYFSLLQIALLRGRDFTAADDSAAAPVAILSATTARRFWPGEEALGSRIRIGDLRAGPLVQIIGIVADVRHLDLVSPEHRPMLYLPEPQLGSRAMTVLARTSGEPGPLAAALRAELRALDPAQPVGQVRTLAEVVEEVYAPQRFNAFVLGLFALAALALAAIGLYGVMAYAVRQRTHELGVRLALGARGGDVLRLVLGESLRLILLGIGLGLGGALLLDRQLAALLFGVEPGDPLALLLASALLLGIALLGSYLPARRAARVDPMETLRGE